MKTNLNYFKRTVILLFAVGTLSSAEECDWFESSGDEQIDCDVCISKQIHLCEALGRTNGNLDEAQDAVDAVKKACGSLGSAKVNDVYYKYHHNFDNLNCSSRGFTCK